MTTYDLERLSVLIVDDSAFARTLLSRILRSLNIRQITTACDGSDAINIMKAVAKDPVKMGVQRFDLILCDWVMSPVDGAMFLKWVRRHKDSPNPFIPFVMMSAMAEAEKVQQARDMGAHEFLAKPFSIATISAKLTTLIERPRPFIFAPNYFGPDRRRQQIPIALSNRRTTTKEQIEIIHNGKIPTSFKEGVKAYYIRVPNALKEAVSGIGQDKVSGNFDRKALDAATDEILEMASDYADWVSDSVEKMLEAYRALAERPKNHWKYFTQISAIAHELRGQGETFGYPLISDFGKSLFEYTRINVPPDERYIALIHAHISAIQAVLREKMKGDGGVVGKIIVETLDTAKKQYEEQRVS
jgi:CheY-like chemotaxis protein